MSPVEYKAVDAKPWAGTALAVVLVVATTASCGSSEAAPRPRSARIAVSVHVTSAISHRPFDLARKYGVDRNYALEQHMSTTFTSSSSTASSSLSGNPTVVFTIEGDVSAIEKAIKAEPDVLSVTER